MKQLQGNFLNLVLEDLKLNRDLMVNRIESFITVAAASYGPFQLPADYLRTYDVFYQIPSSGGATASSITQFLVSVTMQVFDSEFKSPSISNYPYEYANDLSTSAQTWSGGSPGVGTLTSAGQMFIYPQSSGQLILTHRYMKNQPDIVSPETSSATPWFAHTDYLIEATAARLMGVTGDDRQPQFEASAERKLRPYLVMQGSEQAAVIRVNLDPRTFKFHNNLKPTKASPF